MRELFEPIKARGLRGGKRHATPRTVQRSHRLATPDALSDLDAAARKAACGKKNVSAENAVVGKLLVPTLLSIIEADLANAEQARGVLYSESVEPRKAQQASSLTGAGSSKHAFGKVLSEDAATIAELWSAKGSKGLAQAWPDFARGHPTA